MEMNLPTSRNIDAAISIYNRMEGWKQANRIISSYFRDFPSNREEVSVVVKVVLINSLYYTYVTTPLIVANHILNLERIDEQLQLGETETVDRIANLNGLNLISFASKYAHFHNKTAFPLYDKYVCLAVARFYGKSSYRAPNYQDFFTIIDVIRKLARLDNVSWEDMDKYLWLLGQKLELDRGKTGISKEVLMLYKSSEGKTLFQALEPQHCIIQPTQQL